MPKSPTMTIDNSPGTPQSLVVSQAVIVFTLVEHDGKRGMSVRSFGRPEGPSDEAEGFADAVLKAVAAILEAGDRGAFDEGGKVEGKAQDEEGDHDG